MGTNGVAVGWAVSGTVGRRTVLPSCEHVVNHSYGGYGRATVLLPDPCLGIKHGSATGNSSRCLKRPNQYSTILLIAGFAIGLLIQQLVGRWSYMG